MIYLDYAAATPLDKKVLAVMMPYLTDDFYNPSASYLPARNVRADMEDARHKIASLIGARPAEIIFTAGATESINLALRGVRGRIITTAIEHAAVLNTVRYSEIKSESNTTSSLSDSFRQSSDKLDYPNKSGNDKTLVQDENIILPVDDKGRINLDQLKSTITDDVELISISYANSEIGTIQPIKEIAEIVTKIRADRRERGIKLPLLFHTDASAVAGLLDLNVARLGVDLMTLNAGKCYGPKATGLLYVRAGVELQPVIYGGGQEMGLRSGTENVAGVIGFVRALELAEKHRKTETVRLAKMRDDLQKFLISCHPKLVSGSSITPSLSDSFRQSSDKLDYPNKSGNDDNGVGVTINGAQKHRLPNILNFSISGLDAERVVFALDERGVYVATGAACAANKGTRSHVLTAIGLAPEIADGSIRISLGRPTTQEEIDRAKPILAEVLSEQMKFRSNV
ncbi:MAG: cysteine desulfurase [Candidatus Nomurabacteria bacterium]|jgi:cysteine desulfurase|nr:cysteine desulfurase [Candidatus Nomurabacteria bacterium]